MLTISFLCGEKSTKFAPHAISFPRKAYTPKRSVQLQTVIPSNSKVRFSGVWEDKISHEYKGRYTIDKLNEATKQDMRRDIIALQHAGVRTLRININSTLYSIPCNSNTYKNLKNLILKLLKINSLCKI